MKLAITIIALLAAICILPALGEYTADYWSGQANQYFLNGSFEEAVASYDKALELDPINITLLDNKGRALANLGRFDDAIACFDKALDINSTNLEALNLKGLALSQGLGRIR